MSDPKEPVPRTPAKTANMDADIDVQTGQNGVGTGPGYSGQEYDSNDFAIDKALRSAAEGTSSVAKGDVLPPENGRRAFFDETDGTVHGSGVGAGGGQPGEDFASDPPAGDGFPVTGRRVNPKQESGS
jgi:hypothetical protein